MHTIHLVRKYDTAYTRPESILRFICAKFVEDFLHSKPYDITLEVDTEPFSGAKKITLTRDYSDYITWRFAVRDYVNDDKTWNDVYLPLENWLETFIVFNDYEVDIFVRIS
jgi:hypothetical protein